MKWSRAVVLAAMMAAWSGVAQARGRLYAVVIAQNRSLDPGVRALKYADDDGVKNWELFSLFAERASLFVVPDEETARLHPEAARAAEVPERAAILERLEEYNRLMAEDTARGDEPELFFVYAGHGDVDQAGQGYVNLHDGKLTRADLFRQVVAPSRARFVHVVIDACKSYFMVSSRGGRKWVDDSVDPAEDRSDQKVKAFLEEEQLERYPRAGVIVATSGGQETHEWARYQGGILSHELRSALAGAADVNGDGRVEYSELRAFLAAANARVRNPEARVDVFSRPPALDRHRPLIDLRAAQEAGRQARFLHFAAGLAGRFNIEDERGVRYADLNKEAGSAFDVAISPTRGYYVRRAPSNDPVDDHEEVSVQAPGPRRVDVAQLAFHPRALASRGALDQTFRQDLYRVPFGRGFYDGFVATSGDAPVEDGPVFVVAEPRRVLRHLLSIGYVLSGAPVGNTGLSHGVDLRYGFRIARFLDVGGVVQIGHGETVSQQVSRAAFLADIGFEYDPVAWLALRIDAAIGWQVVWGDVIIGSKPVSGAEPKGLRLELAPSLGFNVWSRLWLVARGGFALDGVYSDVAPASTSPTGFFQLGVQLRL